MNNISNLTIFCDESHPIKHDGFDFFILGCCYTDGNFLSQIKDDIKSIKESFGYREDYEVKWSKINGKNINLIKELIQYVYENQYLFLRIWIVPNKTENLYPFILQHEQLYNRMYRLMLKNIFENEVFSNIEKSTIYFDVRNSRSDDNAKDICDYLILNFNKPIRHTISDSRIEPLIQLIDLFIGAVSYERTKLNTSTNKISVLNYIKKKFGLNSMNIRTKKTALKYNAFIWDGRYGIN